MLIHKLYCRDEPGIERRRLHALFTLHHPMKAERCLSQKSFQFDAVICRLKPFELRNPFRKLAPRAAKILVVEMVKADSDMNDSLKKSSVAPPPLHPYIFNNIVALKKVAVVEQLNTFFELFSLRKYSKFRLKFQLKNALS